MRIIALAAAICCAQPAAAACSASNQFRFDWNTVPNTNLTYNQTRTFTATNSAGASRSFTASFTANGLVGTDVDGQQLPTIRVTNTGTLGSTEKTFTIGGTFSGRTANIDGTTRIVAVTFTFDQPVRDVTFRVLDIDYQFGNWRDWVKISGRHSARPTSVLSPSLTKPAASTVKIGPSAAPLALAANTLLGISDSGSAQDIGTITATFPQPVTSVELRYGNYPTQSGESGTEQQWISIHDISFCPVPNLSVTKSSAPFATTGQNRFNIPDADLVYTLTVANNGGSAVDLNGLVLTDLLPSRTTFYNGDVDPAAPGTDPYLLTAGASGVTLTGANVAYSNNGGTSYAYVPASGYDAAVNGIRFSPGGSLAANSSFTIRFRARVK